MLHEMHSSRRIPTLIVGVAGVAVLTGSWLCPIHAVTGLYCPGCGMTRAILAVLRLDPTTAVHQNALVLVVLPLLIISTTRSSRANAWLQTHRLPLMVSATIVAVAFTVVRNTVAPGLAPF